MSKNDFRIVFMGTPDFAVGILDGLLTNNFNIVATVTAPDKPAGRGQQISQSAVKKYCIEKNVPLLQPTNLKDPEFLAELAAYQADLFVVVAFRMLPELVWNMPPKGTINLHGSLLPHYRGAAPINWAIVNGEKETGVTTFFIEQEIDTGMVIERATVSIEENETAGELHDKLMNLGSDLIVKSVQKIITNEVIRIPQADLITEEELKIAPKIFKPMCKIDWTKSVRENHNFCRGFSPYPTAWTTFQHVSKSDKKTIKIFETEKTDIPVENSMNLKVEKDQLLIPCQDFYLAVKSIQPEGKRRMNAKEFLAGYSVKDWIISQ